MEEIHGIEVVLCIFGMIFIIALGSGIYNIIRRK